ncbi:MAG TPA: TetR family transcriptional regulator [Jatrophihabitans sp.]
MTRASGNVTSLARANYAKGLATRSAIIAVASEAIAELGLSRTTSREVVRRSGFTWGVIQHHFGSYTALLLAVVDNASAGLRSVLAELDVEIDATAVQRVDAVAAVVWDYFRRPEYLGYLEIYLHLLRDPEASEVAREALRAFDVDAEAIWRATMQRLFGDVIAGAAFQRILFATMRGLAVSRWLNEGLLDFANERMIFIHMLADFVEDAA